MSSLIIESICRQCATGYTVVRTSTEYVALCMVHGQLLRCYLLLLLCAVCRSYSSRRICVLLFHTVARSAARSSGVREDMGFKEGWVEAQWPVAEPSRPCSGAVSVAASVVVCRLARLVSGGSVPTARLSPPCPDPSLPCPTQTPSFRRPAWQNRSSPRMTPRPPPSAPARRR